MTRFPKIKSITCAEETATTIRVPRSLSNVIRDLAAKEGKKVHQIINDAIIVYVRKMHRDVQLVLEEEDDEQ